MAAATAGHREGHRLRREPLPTLDRVQELLDAAGVGWVRIDGKRGGRKDALRDFEHDPEVRVLLGTRVLERGLNLQHARLLVSLDSSYNPAREAQREGRICRIGSPHATYEHVTFLGDTPTTREKWADVGDSAARWRLTLASTPKVTLRNHRNSV